jgi:hypothetical protein
MHAREQTGKTLNWKEVEDFARLMAPPAGAASDGGNGIDLYQDGDMFF